MRRRKLGIVVIAFLILMFLNITVLPSRVSKNTLFILDIIGSLGALISFLVFNHVNKWNDDLKPPISVEAIIFVLIALFVTFSKLSSQHDENKYKRMRTVSGALSAIAILITFGYYATLWTNKEMHAEKEFPI